MSKIIEGDSIRPPEQYNFFNIVENPYTKELQAIRLALEVVPQYLRHLKHWQERPNGDCLIVDLTGGKGVIVNPNESQWTITGRFDDYVPYGPKRYSTAITVSLSPIDPSENEAKLHQIAGKLVQKGRTGRVVLGRMFVMEVVPNEPDPLEGQRRIKALQQVDLVKGSLILIRNPQTPYPSGYDSTVQSLLNSNNLLIWEARVKKPAKPPEISGLEKRLKVILDGIERKYSLLGFRVINGEELHSRLREVKNLWVWQGKLNQGIGVMLEGVCGCRWNLGENILIPPACPTHQEETPISPKDIEKIIPVGKLQTQKKEYSPFTTVFNLRDRDRKTNIPCEFGGCDQLLDENTRLISVTERGYLLLVDYVCTHEHSWQFTDIILADGPTKETLRTIRVISREFPSW